MESKRPKEKSLGRFSVWSVMAEDRKSSAARGYGSRWQKARDSWLKRHPLCKMHAELGAIVPATVVDHVIPHRGDKALFWDSTNWQSLCKECHDRHKKRLENSGAVVGCDLTGMPIDPAHPWRQGGGSKL